MLWWNLNLEMHKDEILRIHGKKFHWESVKKEVPVEHITKFEQVEVLADDTLAVEISHGW